LPARLAGGVECGHAYSHAAQSNGRSAAAAGDAASTTVPPATSSARLAKGDTVLKHVRIPMTFAIAAIMLLAMAPGIASAHEKRQVGAFTFVVGFINEPAIVDQPNSIDLTITDASNQPVTGVEKTL
jgi:hypothetical protein